MAKAPGVVTGRYGTIGQVFFVTTDFWPLNTTLYVRDFKGNDPKFVSYFLRTIDFDSCSDKAAVPGVNRNHLHQLPVRVPPLAVQREIARIVGALDDKIELNRKTNETLEAMARALFKSWFVDFDPVRAKAEGRAPSGMDAETAKLFPSELVESELGLIPRGWRVGRLDEAVSVETGLSPPGDSYNVDGVGSPLINGPVEFGEYFPIKSKWTTAATRTSKPGDLVFCVRGSTTGRRVVSDGAYALGRGVCAIRPGDFPASYLYQAIAHDLPRMLALTTGSVFPSLSAPSIKGFPVVIPSADAIAAFKSRADAPLRCVQSNHRESQCLRRVRDELLPRLLSGELEVHQAGAP